MCSFCPCYSIPPEVPGLYREPATMLEYGVMLLLELFVGFTLGFAMELSVMVVRFASSAMDYVMGLNMAQIYDPSTIPK